MNMMSGAPVALQLRVATSPLSEADLAIAGGWSIFGASEEQFRYNFQLNFSGSTKHHQLTFDNDERGVFDVSTADAVVDDALKLSGVGFGGIDDGQVQGVAVQHRLDTPGHVVSLSHPLDSVLLDWVGVYSANQLGCLIGIRHDVASHFRYTEKNAKYHIETNHSTSKVSIYQMHLLRNIYIV